MKRYAFLPLKGEHIDLAKNGEIILDFENGHVKMKDYNGNIISATGENAQNFTNFVNSLSEPSGGELIGTSVTDMTSDNLKDLLDEFKTYIDATKQRLVVKDSAKVCSTSDIGLYGLQSLDGVTLSEGDRVLVTGQDDKVMNGIYNASDDSWTRTIDADEQVELENGAFIFVEEGNTFGNSGWTLATDNDPKPGHDELEFKRFSGAGQIVAGVGIEKEGNLIKLTTTGVVAGNYTKVTVDENGRITSAENPTTLEGHGITDAAPKSHVGSSSTEAHPIASVENNGFMSKEMYGKYSKLVEQLDVANKSNHFFTDGPTGIIGSDHVGNDIVSDIKPTSLTSTELTGMSVYNLIDCFDSNNWNLTNATFENGGVTIQSVTQGDHLIELLYDFKAGEKVTLLFDVISDADVDLKFRNAEVTDTTMYSGPQGKSKFVTVTMAQDGKLAFYNDIYPSGLLVIVKGVFYLETPRPEFLINIPYSLSEGLTHSESVMFEVTNNNNLLNVDWEDSDVPEFLTKNRIPPNTTMTTHLESVIIPPFPTKLADNFSKFKNVEIDNVNSKLVIETGNSEVVYTPEVSPMFYVDIGDNGFREYDSSKIELYNLTKFDKVNLTTGELTKKHNITTLDSAVFNYVEKTSFDLRVLQIPSLQDCEGLIINKFIPFGDGFLGEFDTIDEFVMSASHLSYGKMGDDVLMAFDINFSESYISSKLDNTEMLYQTYSTVEEEIKPINFEVDAGSSYKFSTKRKLLLETSESVEYPVLNDGYVQSLKSVDKIVMDTPKKQKVSNFNVMEDRIRISGFEPFSQYQIEFDVMKPTIFPMFKYIVPLNTLSLIQANFSAIKILEDKFKDVNLTDKITQNALLKIKAAMSDRLDLDSSQSIATSKAIKTVNDKVEDAQFLFNKILEKDGANSGLHSQYFSNRNISDFMITKPLPNRDFNDATNIGIYKVDSITDTDNGPNQFSGKGVLMVSRTSDSIITQMLSDESGKFAIRIMENEITPKKWKIFYGEGDDVKFNTIDLNGSKIRTDNGSIIIKP